MRSMASAVTTQAPEAARYNPARMHMQEAYQELMTHPSTKTTTHVPAAAHGGCELRAFGQADIQAP